MDHDKSAQSRVKKRLLLTFFFLIEKSGFRRTQDLKVWTTILLACQKKLEYKGSFFF